MVSGTDTDRWANQEIPGTLVAASIAGTQDIALTEI